MREKILKKTLIIIVAALLVIILSMAFLRNRISNRNGQGTDSTHTHESHGEH